MSHLTRTLLVAFVTLTAGCSGDEPAAIPGSCYRYTPNDRECRAAGVPVGRTVAYRCYFERDVPKFPVDCAEVEIGPGNPLVCCAPGAVSEDCPSHAGSGIDCTDHL